MLSIRVEAMASDRFSKHKQAVGFAPLCTGEVALYVFSGMTCQFDRIWVKLCLCVFTRWKEGSAEATAPSLARALGTAIARVLRCSLRGQVPGRAQAEARLHRWGPVLKGHNVDKFTLYSVGNGVPWQFGSREMTWSGNSESEMKAGSEKRMSCN